MCLIIVKRKGEVFKEKWFNEGWEKNPDGAGIMYAVDGEIRIFKSMVKEEVLLEFNKANSLYGKESDIVIHLRWGTHGTKNIINVHPFKVNDKLWFCHNGVFNKVNCDSDKTLSDSQHFNMQCLQQLPEGFIYNKIIREMLDEFCGCSKLVFLDYKGETYIINKKLGTDHCNNWFSNTYFRKEKTRYVPPTFKNKYYGYADDYSDYPTPDEDYLTWWQKNYNISTGKTDQLCLPTSNTVVTETKNEVVDGNNLDKQLAEMIDISDKHFNKDLNKTESEDMYAYLNRIK